MQLSYPPSLPISEHLDVICDTVRNHQVVIIAGDTGSGKTTQLPKMCLDAGFGLKGRIGCTQPRRIAAISVAERVNEETGSNDLVGYKIRFKEHLSPQAKIKFMTDGILLAETKSDPLLKAYEVLIIDEAHERSLNIDFLLGYIKQLLRKRPDLKLIISSATIDTDKFSAHFNEAPVLSVSGRLHPISTIYHDPVSGSDDTEKDEYVDHAVRVIEELYTDPLGGDILCFMPTERDIFDTINAINDLIRDNSLILPLFGRLQSSDQKRIFRSSSKRKIIVATNIAETSITVPGIRFVIDTGLARISRYNPRTGTTSLRITKISRASCDQRQGRCGRTGPGTCIRLYSEEDYLGRDEHTLPEIQRSNLAEVILQMVNLKLGDPSSFPFIDPPTPRTIREGYRTLRELDALTEDHRLTKPGKIMATLPLDPRISRIIIEGNRQHALRETVIIAAALSIQDPRIRPLDKEQKADQAHQAFVNKQSDFLTLLNIWNLLYQENEKLSWSQLGKFCKEYYLSWQRMREWIDVREQIDRLLVRRKDFSANEEPAAYASLHKALTAGFLRNICKKKEKNKYTTTGGREVVLFPGSSMYNRGSDWITAANFVETTQVFARTAANIDPAWLEELGGSLCKHSWTNPRWEKKSGRVIADEHVSLFGMPIVSGRKINYGRINQTTRIEARQIFIHEALVHDQLGGRYHFIELNRKLLNKYRELEERLRSRTLIVEEEQLYAFYDQRIKSAYDRYTLNRLLKKRNGDFFLHMTKEDICLDSPLHDELYRFPQRMHVGELELALTYKFEPGKEEDGVTSMIPQAMLPHINPQVFEWLVPGLLPEKLLFLFKRLPKRLRKNLVPLPDTVDRVMDSIELYKGSLYQCIESALLKTHNLTVNRQDWQPEALPPHLKMRFCVIDDKGKPTITSRSFNDILHRVKDSGIQQKSPTQTTLPKVTNISSSTLDTIEHRIAFSANGRVTELYFPILHIDDKSGQINVEYNNDKSKALETNRHGLAALYAREFPSEAAKLRKKCKQAISENSASWLALGGGYSAGRLKESMFVFILASLFAIDGENLPDHDLFQFNVELVKEKGFFRSVTPIFTTILENLKKRKETKQAISSWEQRARKAKSYEQARHQEYLNALESILPFNFLEQSDHESLTHSIRYLQGLIIRIQRAEHSPEKDRKKAQRLTGVLNHLQQCDTFSSQNAACRELKKRYRKLAEEFRISVFAPELGTSTPVSEKKLKTLWLELEGACRTVE